MTASTTKFAAAGWAVIAASLFMAVYWNPIDYFTEAGGAAYYQARIGYERGTSSDKSALAQAFADGKLSVHDYAEYVFPAYLRVVKDGEMLFPAAEQAKPAGQLRADLATATGLKLHTPDESTH